MGLTPWSIFNHEICMDPNCVAKTVGLLLDLEFDTPLSNQWQNYSWKLG